ncbi:MAG: 50S ribosomal protein L17 [Syntrophales bacterium]|nr:50S ribosomal protein L17 [Syntrophales bacterium]
MRHGKAGSKLGRTSSHRKAMLRNMVTSFLKYEKVKTTDVKAKELKKVAEKMITLGKRGDLHARRQALAFVRDPEVVGKLFSELSERYRQRTGGYTRIIKMGYRTGDNAPLSSIEFIDTVQKKKPKKKAVPAAS